jgi:hypothetical protein
MITTRSLVGVVVTCALALAVGGCQGPDEPAGGSRAGESGELVTSEEPTEEPTGVVPTDTPTPVEPTDEPTPTEQTSADDAQCEDTDETLAEMLGVQEELYDIFPTDGAPPYDWDRAEEVHAETVQIMEDWAERTTDPLLLEDYEPLREAMDELGEVIDRRDDADVTFGVLDVAIAGTLFPTLTLIGNCPNLEG